MARNVVIATGHCDVPWVPPVAEGLANDVFQTVPSRYRNPAQLPAGNVLVVGASASGVQLAEELAVAGRKVTLAVGRHTRLAGKVTGADAHRVRFDDNLAEIVREADDQMAATLAKIDEFAATMGFDDRVGRPEVVSPILLDRAPTELDLREENIATVLWATGYRRSYPWLKVPVLDERGEIRNQGGITEEPGLYVLGLRFQRRKNSNFIDGVGNDAAELARHLVERRHGQAA